MIQKSVLFLLIMLFSTALNTPSTQLQNAELTLLQSDVQTFALSPIEDQIVVQGIDESLYVMDVQSLEQRVELESSPLVSPLNQLRWSDDGRFILAGFDDGGRAWDASTGHLLYHFTDHPVSNPYSGTGFAPIVNDIVMAPNDHLIATVSEMDSEIILYDTDTFEVVQSLPLRDQRGNIMIVSNLAFDPNGRFLAGHNWLGGDVLLWEIFPNPETGLSSAAEPVNLGLGSVAAFSHDGTRIALSAGREYSEVTVWEVESGELLQRFFAPLNAQKITWSSDDTQLFLNVTDFPLISEGFSYAGMGVLGFDVNTGQNISTFTHPPTDSYTYDLQPNQIVLGIDSFRGRILSWDVRTNNVTALDAASSSNLGTPNVFITPQITGFALSRDGALLATISWSEMIVWETDTQTARSTVAILASKVDWLAFSNTLILLNNAGELFSMRIAV